MKACLFLKNKMKAIELAEGSSKTKPDDIFLTGFKLNFSGIALTVIST